MLTAKQYPYTGPLHRDDKSPTAEALKRALSRLGWIVWDNFDQAYNQKLIGAMSDWQISVDITPATGEYGKASWEKMRSQRIPNGARAGQYAMDAYGLKLVRDEAAGNQQPPALIEPYQGFESLVPELWPAYTLGRQAGLLDGPHNGHPTASGTYANKPGDHGYWPAYAFDLDIIQHTGWANLTARAFFEEEVKRHDELHIHYVILGDKIWSTERGLHAYTAGGHDNHVHTSGIH